MWKPYDFCFACRGELSAFTRECFVRLRTYSSKTILSLVTSTITVVAFLLAVDYFTAKPSLNIGVNSRPVGYYMASVLAFYEQNNVPFPRQLLEDQSLRDVFTPNARLTDTNYADISDSSSDEEVVRAILRGQELGWYNQRRIELLEKQIGKYTYTKHIYDHSDGRGFYNEQEFMPILDGIRSKLSESDYFIFLAALIHSREVFSHVSIKNDGHVDLRNVRITFPGPMSKVTETRDSILHWEVVGSLLNEVVDNEFSIVLYLPSLKRGEFVGLVARTRENEVVAKDIFSTYERDKLVDKRKVYGYFFLILMVMLALYRLCRGSESQNL